MDQRQVGLLAKATLPGRAKGESNLPVLLGTGRVRGLEMKLEEYKH